MPGRRGRAARRLGGQLQPQPRLARPVRQQHAEPRARQQRPGLAQEVERARGVERRAGSARPRAAPRRAPGTAARPRPARPAVPPPGRRRRRSQPNPAPSHTSSAGSIRLGSSADCSESSTCQSPRAVQLPPMSPRHRRPASAGRDRAARPAGSRSAPGRPGARRRPATRRTRTPAPVPRARRPRPPPRPGDRSAVRDATVRSITGIRAGRRPRLAGSRAPGSRVRAVASASASSMPASSGPGAVSAAAAAGGRDRGRELAGALRVGGRQHRPPAGRVPVVLRRQRGQHPAPRDQVVGEPRDRGQIPDRPADGQVPGRRIGWRRRSRRQVARRRLARRQVRVSRRQAAGR